MKAIVFDKELKLEKEYLIPVPKENEVVIKTHVAGLCNTDYELTKGYMGFSGVLGHEFVGTVVDTGCVGNSYLVGKRVIGEINCGCHDCDYCAQGLFRHCPNRQTLGIYNKDGCMSEFFTLPVENVIEVPQAVSDDEATFVEPVAAALEILEQVHIKPMDKVALLGDGKLGLSIALVLSALNIDVTHIGKHQSKLDISKQAGAKTMLLGELTQKDLKSYDIVIEATGSTGGFETSLSLVKPRGVLVLKSTIAAKEGLNLATVVIDEIQIVGSRCGRFEPALQLLKDKKINVAPLISKVYNIDEALEAFEANKQKDVIKVLIKF